MRMLSVNKRLFWTALSSKKVLLLLPHITSSWRKNFVCDKMCEIQFKKTTIESLITFFAEKKKSLKKHGVLTWCSREEHKIIVAHIYKLLKKKKIKERKRKKTCFFNRLSTNSGRRHFFLLIFKSFRKLSMSFPQLVLARCYMYRGHDISPFSKGLDLSWRLVISLLEDTAAQSCQELRRTRTPFCINCSLESQSEYASSTNWVISLT